MSRGYVDDRSSQFCGECGSLFRGSKAQFGVDRKCSEPLPGCGSKLSGTGKFRLHFGGQPEKVFRRKRVSDLRRVGGKFAEQFGRKQIAARRGHKALFEEVAATPASSTREQPHTCQLADMIVDRLSGQVQAPCHARGGIGLEKCRENLQTERVMKEHGGLRGFADQVETRPGRRGRGLRRSRTGDSPAAAAGDTHDVACPRFQERRQCPMDQIICQDLLFRPLKTLVLLLPHRSSRPLEGRSPLAVNAVYLPLPRE